MPLRVGPSKTALGRKRKEEGRGRIGRMPEPSTRRYLGFLRRTASVSCQRDRSVGEGHHLIGPSEDFRAVAHQEHRVKSSPSHRRPVRGEKLAVSLYSCSSKVYPHLSETLGVRGKQCGSRVEWAGTRVCTAALLRGFFAACDEAAKTLTRSQQGGDTQALLGHRRVYNNLDVAFWATMR